jgi:ATP-dependent DNA helicase RecG
LDPQALYDGDDWTWLGHPDRQVEGSFVERKEWCDANELARQISGFANGQPPGGLIVVGVTTSGERKGIDERRSALEESLGRLGALVESVDWKYRWVQAPKTLLFVYVPFDGKRVVCLSNGKAYRRQGESTIELKADQIVELRYALGERSFELEPAAPITEDLLDPEQEKAFLDGVTKRNGLTLPTTIREALVNKGLIEARSGALNFAGLLAVGRAPADLLSGARLRFLKFEGTEEASGTQRNVVKDTWFDGPIPRLVAEFRLFMKSTIREFDYLGKDGRFIREPEYPEFALDEAVVNALVHRSYSLRNAAVFVRMFDDRIEVESPGIFPGNARPDSEGVFPFSAPRNPKLAQALQYLEIVRLAKEGTRRMHDEMTRLGLPAPQFREIQSAKVVVTLFNDLERRRSRVGADEANRKWDEVIRHLVSDLAIERRQALSMWESLAARNASAPTNVTKVGVDLVRSDSRNSQEKERLLRLLDGQPANTLGDVAKGLFEGLIVGEIDPAPEVAGQVTHILGRADDVVEQIISWIETAGPSPQLPGDVLKTAFLAIAYRLRRDRLPSREWLDRVCELAKRHKDVSSARSLYAEITGREP